MWLVVCKESSVRDEKKKEEKEKKEKEKKKKKKKKKKKRKTVDGMTNVACFWFVQRLTLHCIDRRHIASVRGDNLHCAKVR